MPVVPGVTGVRSYGASRTLPISSIVSRVVQQFVGTPADTTPPVAALVSESRTRISAATGFSSTDVVWSANEDIQAWQFRLVADPNALVVSGTPIVSATQVISAGANQTTTITQAEIAAAGALEGNNTIKLFVQDIAGNWSI